MKRGKNGSTPKQYAYATKRLSGDGRTKKDIALSVGYSSTIANNIKHKVEETEGYQNAVIELARKSNNVVLAVLAEYEARGLEDFSNKDLNGALNAIASAFEKFNKVRAPNSKQDENPLRKAILQKIENQTIHISNTPVPSPIPPPVTDYGL